MTQADAQNIVPNGFGKYLQSFEIAEGIIRDHHGILVVSLTATNDSSATLTLQPVWRSGMRDYDVQSGLICLQGTEFFRLQVPERFELEDFGDELAIVLRQLIATQPVSQAA